MRTVVVGEAIPTVPSRSMERIEYVDLTRLTLVSELENTAREILNLNAAFDVVSSVQDPSTFDRICIRLSAAEQDFYILFNQLRLHDGFPVYPSLEEFRSNNRFVGDYDYTSHLSGR